MPLLAGLGGAAVPPRTWAATAVALSGLAAMELLPALAPAAGAVVAAGAAPHGEGAGLAGDAASVLSASFFALQLVRTQHHSARLAGAEADSGSDSASASASGSDLGPGSDAEGESGAGFAPALVAAQLFTLALLFALAAAVQHLSDASSAAPHAAPPSAAAAASASAAILAALPSLPWAAWLFTGLVSTAGPLWAETEALRVVSAPDAALVYSAEPVWGAAAAAALLGERWSGATWLGAALILSASVYGQAGGGGGGGGGGDGDGKEEGGGGAAAARAG